ncbi:MAG TPA: pantoate--beta-alanine ligase [Gammaproteobacteria bacterium]|jgi:pantoate--beta-alanine ligase|nr:pantoate--beta-alanine ligase [Gammaproteobacteria bacterium]
MLTEHSVAELRKRIQRWRAINQQVALVPTMGNLHAGHIALVKRARALADRVVVSIFVNPLQFGPKEDFAAYPRTPDADRLQLAVAGTDLLFMPEVEEMYPGGMDQVSRVEVPAFDSILDGAARPGHFAGVATVVTKLFNMVQPDVAVFGEKDYQQLLVIRRMTADLCLPVQVVGHPTVREPDGLAMSSRNQYLSKSERVQAPLLRRVLTDLGAKLREGTRDFGKLQAEAARRLTEGGFRPDYVEIRHADTLALPKPDDERMVVLAAAWLGKARLIDNLPLDLAAPQDKTVTLSETERVG